MGVAVTMCKSRHKPSVLATFLIAVTDKKQIKVEGFVLAYSSRGFSSSWRRMLSLRLMVEAESRKLYLAGFLLHIHSG